MYSVVNKIYVVAAVVFVMASTFMGVSCNSESKRQQASADSLLSAIKNLISVGNYDSAFVLMDTLDSKYPEQIETRHELALIRSQAMADYSQAQLISTDSLIAELEAQIESLQPKFYHLPGDDISGYYVVKSVRNPDFLVSNSIEARTDDEDLSFYIVAINNGRHIGINQLIFEGNEVSMSTNAIPEGNERCGDIDPNGIDMASFMSSETSPAIDWLKSNMQSVNRVILKGKGGNVSVPLSVDQLKAIIDTWTFADAASRLKLARLRHDKLERQLIIARDHTVNLQ